MYLGNLLHFYFLLLWKLFIPLFNPIPSGSYGVRQALKAEKKRLPLLEFTTAPITRVVSPCVLPLPS